LSAEKSPSHVPAKDTGVLVAAQGISVAVVVLDALAEATFHSMSSHSDHTVCDGPRHLQPLALLMKEVDSVPRQLSHRRFGGADRQLSKELV
jgi:hypothetical protein